MSFVSLGDLSRSFGLRNQTTVLKADLDRRAFEATTGKVADAGRHLGGNFTSLSAIDSSLARLTAVRSATTDLALMTQSMQESLSTLSELATGLASTLVSLSPQATATSVTAVGQEARERFRTAVAALNLRVGDRSLFAGNETQRAALAPPEEILDALAAAAAGATSAADVEAALVAWADDAAGFAAQAYRGGAALDPVPIGAEDSVRIDQTAADPAIRATLVALGMAALLDRGILAGDPLERAKLAVRAGERLIEGSAARTEMAARLGSAEQRIEAASTRNEAERTALRIARSELVEVDGYEASTALTDAEARLDTIYAITARLQRLSLADYL